MPRITPFLAAVPLLLALLSGAAAAQPKALPMPERVAPSPELPDIDWLKAERSSLEVLLGRYPPQIESEEQRAFVYARWTRAIQRAWQIEAAAPKAEGSLGLLAELYRFGHNLGVDGAAERADLNLRRCLSVAPDSIACHFSAARFYLSIHPRHAAKAESSLLRLRELLKPEVNREVEGGLAFAYLRQGRRADTLRQLEHVLTLEPDAEWALRLREGVLSGAVGLRAEP